MLTISSCTANAGPTQTASATPLILTATLQPTLTALPTETPLPPPPTPTLAPVEGISSTQLNVRAEPSTASAVLGIIPPNTNLQIIGKDPGGSWWQIMYPAGTQEKGWVTAQYVTSGSPPEVPVIGGGEANPNDGNVAIVQQQLNVRSGPGADFNSVGTLNPQDVVGLIGKDANGVWLQISFPAGSGPEGKGWISAAFVQAQGVENLPIIMETGLIIGTGTPTGIPFTPTPTVVPAWDDHDSPSGPIASVIFEATGTQTLIYNGDISSPQGDSQDWIAFSPYDSFVFVSLECTGGNSLRVDMTKNNLPASLNVGCGDRMKQIEVEAGADYLIHLQTLPSAENLQYINYTLTIKTKPL